MRKIILLITLVSCLMGCSQKRVDPAAGAPNFPLQVEKFDSAFFEMDTFHMQTSMSKLQANYPNFTNDFITKVLMIQSAQDTGMIKTFIRIYMPVYKESKTVNAIKFAKPILEDGFKHLHFFFPNYALSHKLTLFVGPLGLFKNILLKDAVAVGLQMYLGENSSWYQSEKMQFISPNYERRKLKPDYIAVDAVENIIEEMPKLNEPINLLNQLIEAGKLQYILNACLPNLADSILFGFTNEQVRELKKEEAKIWDYIVAEKLLYTTNESDIAEIIQDQASNNIFGEVFPGNVGKFIGYKIVDAWMQQKEQSNISFEALLQTPAQKIFNNAKYAP
jgi:hypothetical protein